MRQLSNGYLLVAFLLFTLAGCRGSRAPQDAVDRVASRFHVPRERVIEVAEELGVDPDAIETFGDSYYFPYNYYERQFEVFEQEHGRPPTRSEVEQLVKGYVAKCERGLYAIQYIYYSERAHPEWTNPEVAMVIEIVFRLPPPNEPVPEDPEFAYMRPVELQDASVNPPGNRYWDRCIQEYLREH